MTRAPRLAASLARLSNGYQFLVHRADEAFQTVLREYETCVRCERRCADCCHAVFGLFLFEAVHLKQHFDELDEEERRAALLRCGRTEEDLAKLKRALQSNEHDPGTQARTMATTRVRCPLLGENDECVLYAHRPITCRVYGIPTRIRGAARVCGKAEFREGQAYPVYDLDAVYGDLVVLSKELLNGAEKGDPEQANLLISVPKAIRTTLDDLIDEIFG